MSTKDSTYYQRNKEKVKERNKKWREENREAWRQYNASWMMVFRKRERSQRLLMRGKCPFCEFILESYYHKQFPCQSYTHAIRASVGSYGIACL